MTTDSKSEKKVRERLSIDLEAYPDVKEMLLDAMDATGSDKTELTVEALRTCLPDVVHRVAQRKLDEAKNAVSKAKKFHQKHMSEETDKVTASDASQPGLKYQQKPKVALPIDRTDELISGAVREIKFPPPSQVPAPNKPVKKQSS